ncbi:MAG: glycosyltransferase, partial [Planctomycetota bacterium]
MHVVHIIPFASRIGGYETQGRLLARATAARGVEVTIATDASHAKATRRLAPEVRVVGIGYRFRRFSRRACSSAVKTATVIHAHALAPLTACVIDAARDRGIPAVVKIATAGDVREFNDPWTNPPQVLDAPQSNPQWLANQQRDMSRAWDVLRGSQCFVALNRAIADELMRTGVTSEQILHLPNAVRIPQRPIDVRPDGRHAVYLGRFEERKRLGAEALARFGLGGRESDSAHLLSGGEKQRLALACIFAMQPDILVMDEPTALLDHPGRRHLE